MGILPIHILKEASNAKAVTLSSPRIWRLGYCEDTHYSISTRTNKLTRESPLVPFLESLYNSARGSVHVPSSKPASSFFTKATKSSSSSSQIHHPKTSVITNNFRIYFPTHRTVTSSTGGADSGGTICFQAKWYKVGLLFSRTQKDLSRHFMRRPTSTRKRNN